MIFPFKIKIDIKSKAINGVKNFIAEYISTRISRFEVSSDNLSQIFNQLKNDKS